MEKTDAPIRSMTRRFIGAPTLLIACSWLAYWVIGRESSLPTKHSITIWMPGDLAVYVLAARHLMAGGNLYDQDFRPDLPFTYPPFSGFLFTLISDWSDEFLTVLWQGANLGALIAVAFLVVSSMGKRITPVVSAAIIAFCGATLCLDCMHGGFYFGQINLLLMLLVALDFLPANKRFAGVGVGLAAGLKLTPAFFGVVFLVQRRYKAALVSFLTFLGTVLIGQFTVPDASRFWTHAIFDSSRVGEHDNPGAQSIRSLLSRSLGIDSGLVWLLIVLVVLAVALWAVYQAHLRGEHVLVMGFGGITACLISPFSWYHHWVWVIPVALWALVKADNLTAVQQKNAAQRNVALRWLLGQATMLVAVALVCVALLPFASPLVAPPFTYWAHAETPLHPWNWAMIGTGFAYIVVYGVISTVLWRKAKTRSVSEA